MMNIVILTGAYYPYFSPNGSVMKNIVDELKKHHNVRIIATRNRFELSQTCEYEGYKILRVNDFETCIHNYLTDKLHNSNNVTSRQYYNLLLQGKRVAFFFKRLIRTTSINKSLVKKQISALKDINNTFSIDAIIAISAPYESIVSAIEYKMLNDTVKILPYQLDHFSEANTLHNFSFIKRLRYDKHILIEKNCIKNSCHYFILPQIESHYSKEEFRSFENKVTVCEHPLLKEKEDLEENNQIMFLQNKVNIVFAGTLNKKKRNPKYLLNMLNLIPKSEGLCLNVFHMGDCDDIIDNYKYILGDGIKNFGQVPLDVSFWL